MLRKYFDYLFFAQINIKIKNPHEIWSDCQFSDSALTVASGGVTVSSVTARSLWPHLG